MRKSIAKGYTVVQDKTGRCRVEKIKGYGLNASAKIAASKKKRYRPTRRNAGVVPML